MLMNDRYTQLIGAHLYDSVRVRVCYLLHIESESSPQLSYPSFDLIYFSFS